MSNFELENTRFMLLHLYIDFKHAARKRKVTSERNESWNNTFRTHVNCSSRLSLSYDGTCVTKVVVVAWFIQNWEMIKQVLEQDMSYKFEYDVFHEFIVNNYPEDQHDSLAGSSKMWRCFDCRMPYAFKLSYYHGSKPGFCKDNLQFGHYKDVHIQKHKWVWYVVCMYMYEIL